MAIVLKAGSIDDQKKAARKTSAIAGFNLRDIADEGRTRLEECRVQSQQMLEQAKRDVDEIRKAGKTKYIGLSECSAATLRKANSSKVFSRFKDA